jgi:type IV pilus assembly protein PilB
MSKDEGKNLKGQELQAKLEEIKLRGQEENAKEISKTSGFPYVNLKVSPIDTATVFIVPEEDARRGNLASFQRVANTLKIAVQDPTNIEAKTIVDGLKKRGYEIELYIASPLGLDWAWKKYEEKQEIEAKTLGRVDIEVEKMEKFQQEIKDFAQLKEKLATFSTTELFGMVIAGALKMGASDLHFEPEEKQTRLRYRIDGVLQDVIDINPENYKKLLSRIKLTSGLKINITQAAQDGRFTIRLKEVDIEVRVSVLPGAYGETVVMRILDPRSIKTSIEDLGFRPDVEALIKKQLDRAAGAVLMTGPTGSGKTTSLYAFLNYLNEEGIKIITIENPIEYHIEGISQTQIDAAKGYTFANGLRAIVRQDPDVILVGEIRDRETAEIAMNASLTGHVVLSTLHTNDAAGALPRLINLGVDPVIIAPAITTAMAQRLVRKLCEPCKVKSKVTAEDLEKLKTYLVDLPPELKVPELNENIEIYYPKPDGCPKCNGMGYKGRIAVLEVILIDDEMEQMILSRPAISEIRALAKKKGTITLVQDGFMKVLDGVTSIEEVEWVIGY